MGITPDHERWLDAFAAAARRATEELAHLREAGQLQASTGQVGAGGDETLLLDDRVEEIVLDELSRVDGAPFNVITEERGVIGASNVGITVAIDPVDGSLNVKRGLGHSSLSIAVADGRQVDDVFVAFVYDLTAAEAFFAAKEHGAFLNGRKLDRCDEFRVADGRLELLCVESSDADAIARVAAQLAAQTFRWRILGSIATAMCQVAAGRVDGMVNVSRCRMIDVAAAALVVREAGGTVIFSGSDNPPLDLDTRMLVAAAPTPDTAARLLETL